MNRAKNILLLDDSEWILEELTSILQADGYTPFAALTVEDAVEILAKNRVDFAVVDLFLLGDCGAELSNNFIAEYLTEIPYLRLTGDPNSVPKNKEGYGVISKAAFQRDPSLVLDQIEHSFTKYE